MWNILVETLNLFLVLNFAKAIDKIGHFYNNNNIEFPLVINWSSINVVNGSSIEMRSIFNKILYFCTARIQLTQEEK